MAEKISGSIVVVSEAAQIRDLLGAPKAASPKAVDEPTPAPATEHEVVIGGARVPYRAEHGTVAVHLEDREKPTAQMFYVAYERTDVADRASRPLTFCFNGGPGSSSVWLHMGCFGPRRVRVDVGAVPRPPARAEDHPHSLLDVTDLVFVDPIGTGFSTPDSGTGDEYLAVKADVEAMAEFVRRFTTQKQRWSSPKYLAGESYGTTRAAALAEHLQDRHGLFLNGIVLLSVALQFQTLLFDEGNDLPYILYLPAYALTAAYHGAVDAPDLDAFAAEVEQFAETEYAAALLRGTRLDEAQTAALAARIAGYLGVSEAFVRRCNLRVSLPRFLRELLRERRRLVGRLDSRFVGRSKDAEGDDWRGDPSMSPLMATFAPAFLHDLRTRLGHEDDDVYELLSSSTHQRWKWTPENAYLDLTGALRQALNANEHLGVFVASGLYDLATPYSATEYTLAHLDLEPEAGGAITHERYPAGHMMYVHEPSMVKLKADLVAFYARTT